MGTYSDFFSSGLLAPRVARCTTSVLPSSPITIPTSPVDPVDRHLASPGLTSPCPTALEVTTNAERPKIRRRRSSINVGTSPMALIKSPVRNAGAALQRTGFMSPARHRAASAGINEAFENNSLLGRFRSGSIGGTAYPPKRPRRAILRPIPLAPPPTIPLPAPPLSPTPKCSSSLLPPAIVLPSSRHPITSHSSYTDNAGSLFSPSLPSPTLMAPGYTPN